MKVELPVEIKVRREFHVARVARTRYDLESSLFSLHGQMLLADPDAAQRLAQRINEVRDAGRFPENAVKPGDIYAAGLLDELLHLLVISYLEDVNPNAMNDALSFLGEQFGDDLDTTLLRFVSTFPATPVYTGELSEAAYLEGETAGTPHRSVVLEELLMLYLSNTNPALEPLLDLFDDHDLEQTTPYPQLIEGLERFFGTQPSLVEGMSLFDMLRAPALVSPTSLEGQLDYIRQTWKPLLGEAYETLFTRVLQSLDVMKEERSRGGFGGGGPGPARVIDFSADFASVDGGLLGSVRPGKLKELPAYERFSVDSSWMPRVVMIAKSTYVWLDQLAKTYAREITRLDQIPDEELDELARRGFTSLWLIGLWERSEASRRVKHLRGNPDAVASAYALYDYQIAEALGGDAAYQNLRDRAWARGVRLASDMVPNHVGVDGRWVVEHPEWFLSLDAPPYPGYTFNGPDLSSDERVGIFLEDHYYDSSDAAVVFKRLDRWTGEARYIYHGNDGTTMPWNDTAQLNYLSAEVREAVIQVILHVARKFSVIRFDAAMTLAKIHVQRLWFPEPGEGGAIPSRAQHGSTSDAEFERHFPQEFWREVVDRVAEEVPDTLLLAEAFWMMEPYFVRTLGMHRVYNSAFMHMFKDEENAKYRLTIKNTLEFDPDILKRFVNFMNNPDEETAVAQFGDGDKYFGVCTVMSTLPGLPMFGHGQVEGFHEKYGMEYARAKWDERPNSGLIDRHYHDIFPLLHRRAEFAEVENFLLYDFYTGSGVNENVFAYSNRYGDAASLVLYNNAYDSAEGWLGRSAAYKDKGSGNLVQRDLHEGLGLRGGAGHFTVLRDGRAGLDYLKRSDDLKEGMHVSLAGYGCTVYLDIRERYDETGQLEEIYTLLGGRGVPSLDDTLKDLHYQGVYDATEALINSSPLLNDEKTLLTAYKTWREALEPYGLELSKGQKQKATRRFKALSRALTAYPDVDETEDNNLEPGTPEPRTSEPGTSKPSNPVDSERSAEDGSRANVSESAPPSAEPTVTESVSAPSTPGTSTPGTSTPGTSTPGTSAETAAERTAEDVTAEQTEKVTLSGLASQRLYNPRLEGAETRGAREASGLAIRPYLDLARSLKPSLLLWAAVESLATKERSAGACADALRLLPFWQREYGAQRAELLGLLWHEEGLRGAASVTGFADLLAEHFHSFLNVNTYEGKRWFDQDAFRHLASGWTALQALTGTELDVLQAMSDLATAEARSGYNLDTLLKVAGTPADTLPAIPEIPETTAPTSAEQVESASAAHDD